MRRALLSAPALLALAACNLAPPNVAPPPPVPPAFPTGPAYAPPQPAPPSLSHRDLFRDPRLLALIDQALASNRNLAVAAANVEAARAQAAAVRANQFPTVGVSGGPTFGRRAATGGGALPPGASAADRNFRSFAVSLGLSTFELDVFGRLANLSSAAREQFLSVEANARALRIALIAEVASAYLQLAADESLLAIARETAANAERSVVLTRARLDGGIATRIDVRQAETILNTARSDIARLTTQVAQDRNALRLLLGSEPDPALLPEGLDGVDAAFAAPPAGLDSRVLLRRPDVVAAERQLYAANADIGAARAAFFPTISLTGALGLASNALGRLFSGDAFNFSAGGAAGLPLFDAGRRRANLRVTEAQRDAAVADYELAVQSAFRDVADALARRGTIAAQLEAERGLVTAAADTRALINERYRIGVASSLDVLDAERTLYGARQSLAATRLTAAANAVTLFRVLAADPDTPDR